MRGTPERMGMMSNMLTAAQFVTNIDKFLFDSGMPVDSANILVEGIKARDKEIIQAVGKVFSDHALFNRHGDDVIVCSEELTQALRKMNISLTGED